jgi:hypothetical protein
MKSTPPPVRCPRCQSEDTRPVLHWEPADVLMRALFCEARRCRKCFKRYYAFRFGKLTFK